MGEALNIHMKITNETSSSPAIKVCLFQSIKINTANYKKEREIKLVSQKFKEMKVQKELSDQMVQSFHGY